MNHHKLYSARVTIFVFIVFLFFNPSTQAQSQSCQVRFAVIGDYGFAGKPEADVADLVKNWEPDFIITTGDNNYENGSASSIDRNIGQYYHSFIAPYKGAYGAGADENRFFPGLGNHDWNTSGAQPYLDYFTLPNNERYYDFTWGPIHFFVLDSDPSEPDGVLSTSVQGQWLQSKLQAATELWKVVYFHHSPYSSGLEHGSTEYMRWPFKEWGASVVLSGHDHGYERIVRDGLPYFVNGAGGRSLYPFWIFHVPGSQVRYNDDYGAMLIEANLSSMRLQFITRRGAVMDFYRIDAANAQPPAFVTNLQVTSITKKVISLEWSSEDCLADGFKIEQSSDGETFTEIATVDAKARSYTATGLSRGRTYYYRVRAYNQIGDSVYSNLASATTKRKKSF